MTSIIGAHRVFMDVEDIQPGQNFAQAIEQTLVHCSHVLVVIGPRWHEILQARAQQPSQDYVVHEIATALTQKKTVVPVFVGGATPASLAALPPLLADLSFRQAVELRDSSFNDDCERLASKLQLKSALGKRILLASLIAAIILGFMIGLGPWRAAHQRNLQVAQILNTAKSQIAESDYQSAFDSYQKSLDLDPTNRAALDGQVNAAMLWLENFHVVTAEGQKSEDIAAPWLAQMKTVLQSGLSRTSPKDKLTADILAHLGWLHWLNEKIAFKEFGEADPFFAKALAIDPQNVYAHAFWGNMLLQQNKSPDQAIKHFQIALATNQHRELVRTLQLGGLHGNDMPGMRGELVKALNQVRINHEPLDKTIGDRLSYLYSPTVSSKEELHEVLTAVPPPDEWQTFIWLNPDQTIQRDFIEASLAEIAGHRAEALNEFKTLAALLKAQHANGRIADYTADAIHRLSR